MRCSTDWPRATATISRRHPEATAAADVGEFDLIHRFFRPLATAPGALGLGDDAALLTVGSTDDLVLTTDTIVDSVHFLPDDPADSVGGKLLSASICPTWRRWGPSRRPICCRWRCR